MKDKSLELFEYTVKEYKRFYRQLPKFNITDPYDEKVYVETNTKLMILRKYGCEKENVYIAKIIEKCIEEYPEKSEKLKNILDEYYKIEKQQLEYILSDGTKLNIYNTIEDVMYGIYLHADEKRINRLIKEKEGLRFICVRKYVEQLENIVLKVYEIIQEYKENIELDDKQRATVIFLGDKDNSKQEIVKSTYWSNLYGKDGNKDDIDNLIGNMNKEELEILNTAFRFIEELKKEKISVETLDSLIYSATKKDWGDYIEAQKSYKSLEKPGLSTVVRYNDNHTMAYVRILTHVDDVFIIYDTHVIEELYEISFVKENHKWKIFSMGGHLDSYIIE